MFQPDQVLAAHDAAHQTRNHDLHDLAMRLMDLCGIEHIAVDEFDPEPEGRNDPWFDAPGCVLLKEDAVAQLGPWEPMERALNLYVRDAGNSTWWTEDGLIPRISGFDSQARSQVVFEDPQGIQFPLYDLWLVKKPDREGSNAGGLVPTQLVDVGPLRQFGRYRFPVVAQRLIGERCELHKTGEKTVVLGLDERPSEIEEDLRLIDVPEGIWLGMWDGQTMWMYDCLLSGFEQTHGKPLRHRLSLIPDVSDRLKRLECFFAEDLATLLKLAEGTWLVRWSKEIADIEQPFWFVHESQRVRAGQFVNPVKVLEADPPGRCIRSFSHPDDLRCQVHLYDGRVSIFTGNNPWDRSPQLKQIVDAVSKLPYESLVLDGVLDWNGLREDLGPALNRGDNLSDERVRFMPFDCLLVDDRDLHNLTCSERVRILYQTLGSHVHEHLLMHKCDLIDSDDPLQHMVLLRDPDSVYPLDGSNAGWYIGGPPDAEGERTNDDQEPEPEVAEASGEGQADERTLSRLWVEQDGERVAQDNIPVTMVYRHRHHGFLDAQEVRTIWDALQGPDARKVWKQYKLASLKVPVNDLRASYQDADWRERPRVLQNALAYRFPSQMDLTRVVKPLTVDGQLLIQSPSDESQSFGLTNDVVQASLQFISSEGSIEHLSDDLLTSGTNDQWVAHQNSMMTDAMGFEPDSVPAFGHAILGVQKHDFHEVFLIFDGAYPSGRFVWCYVDVNGTMMWLARRPEEQTPYMFKHDMDEEVQKAREDSGWIAWNPEGIRAIAESAIKSILPMNWEERIEQYDDSPFADFS